MLFKSEILVFEFVRSKTVFLAVRHLRVMVLRLPAIPPSL